MKCIDRSSWYSSGGGISNAMPSRAAVAEKRVFGLCLLDASQAGVYWS